jgi:hypothetical protein
MHIPIKTMFVNNPHEDVKLSKYFGGYDLNPDGWIRWRKRRSGDSMISLVLFSTRKNLGQP